MTQSHEPGPTKAALHYRNARQYQELAQTVMALPVSTVEYNILATPAAGALLYEAAKQCVNSVANLRGRKTRKGIGKNWRKLTA